MGRSSTGAVSRQHVRKEVSRAESEPRMKLGQKHMYPLFEVASKILRAWSQDRRRSRGDPKFDPKGRECIAVNQYCEQAVKSKEVHVDKGRVLEYVEGAYQSLLSCKNPGGVQKWHQRQRKRLREQKSNEK